MNNKFLTYDELKILKDFIKYCEDKTKNKQTVEIQKNKQKSKQKSYLKRIK